MTKKKLRMVAGADQQPAHYLKNWPGWPKTGQVATLLNAHPHFQPFVTGDQKVTQSN